MNTFHIQNPEQLNPLVESDKKTLKNESVVLLIIGIILLILIIRLNPNDTYWMYIALSLLYIIAGISGLIAVKKNSATLMTIFKAIIYVIIVFNVALILLSTIFFVYLIANPVDCSKSKSDTCGLGGAIAILIEIISIVTIIVSGLITFFLVVIIKHTKRYSQDQESARFVYYT